MKRIIAISAVAVLLVLVSCTPEPMTPQPPRIRVSRGATELGSGDTVFFGSTVVGTQKDVEITVTNTGDEELLLSGTPRVSLSGADAAFFSVPVEPSERVSAGQSTTIVLRFSPTEIRSFSASASLNTNVPEAESFTLAIQAEATAVPVPEMDVTNPYDASVASGGSYSAGLVLVNTTLDMTFTVHNTGSAALSLDGSPIVGVSGTDSALFTVTTPPSSSVAAGGSTTFTVRFAPVSPGAKHASLGIPNTDADEDPYVIELSATCTAPEMSVAQGTTAIPSITGSYDFVSTRFDSYTDVDFTISNTGSAPLTLNGVPRVLVTGTDAFMYTVTIQPPSPVAAVTGTSTFRIRFSPTSVGVKTASVTIGSDDPDVNPYTFTLTGTGEALETNQPPHAPEFVTPTRNNEFNLTRIAWRCSDPDGDTLTYTITCNSAIIATGLTTTYYTLPSLTNGTYGIYITANDGHGNTTPSDTWSFSKNSSWSITAPGAPVLMTPMDSVNPATLTWLAPDTWGTGGTQATYTIMVSQAEWPKTTRASGLATPSWTVTGLTAGRWYFRVIADNGRQTTTTEPRAFIIP